MILSTSSGVTGESVYDQCQQQTGDLAVQWLDGAKPNTNHKINPNPNTNHNLKLKTNPNTNPIP